MYSLTTGKWIWTTSGEVSLEEGLVNTHENQALQGSTAMMVAATGIGLQSTRPSSQSSCASCTRPATKPCRNWTMCWPRTFSRTSMTAGTCPTQPARRTGETARAVAAAGVREVCPVRVFRIEAVRAGFKQAWHERDYRFVVKVAERLPESVLQEDAALLMYYDNALM